MPNPISSIIPYNQLASFIPSSRVAEKTVSSEERKTTFQVLDRETLVDSLTLIPRILYIITRLVLVVLPFLIASIFYKSSFADPKKITNNKTPIFLIHGSGSNQRQWEIFRLLLAHPNCGHIFPINLNDNPFINNCKTIHEYAQAILPQMVAIQKRYREEAGLDMDRAIVVGHSMGGMIGGALAVNPDLPFKVEALIALQTPWYGSWIADKLFSADTKPEGAFRTDNPDSQALVQEVLEKERDGDLKLFTFSSTLDPLVRPSSSTLPIRPENQILSKTEDHYSSMVKPGLPRTIRDQWIIPITTELPSAKSYLSRSIAAARAIFASSAA